MDHDEYLALASMEAQRGHANNDGLPFGAIIVKNDRVLSSAHNESRKRNDPTAHSELLAIREARRAMGSTNLAGCVLYSTCKPCELCLQACWLSRIEAVIYEDSKILTPNMDSVEKKCRKLSWRTTSISSSSGGVEGTTTGDRLVRGASDESIEKQSTSWKRSFLKQVGEDERDMLSMIAGGPQRTMKRNLSGGSTG